MCQGALFSWRRPVGCLAGDLAVCWGHLRGQPPPCRVHFPNSPTYRWSPSLAAGALRADGKDAGVSQVGRPFPRLCVQGGLSPSCPATPPVPHPRVYCSPQRQNFLPSGSGRAPFPGRGATGRGLGGLTGSQNFDKPLPSTSHPHPFLGRPGCVQFLSLLVAPGAARPARVASSAVALRSHQYLFLRQLPLSVCFPSSKLRRCLDVLSAPLGCLSL